MTETDHELARAWRVAAALPRTAEVLTALECEIAEATRRARPLCVASGRCCHFEAFGHRLYLTGLETAWFLDRLGREASAGEIAAAQAAGTCPFLNEGLCTVHLVRPFGCRTYFCDPRARDWQHVLHERCHEAVRRLHDELAVPYRYAEWRTMLAHFATHP